jgi:ComF family protein
MQITLSPFKRFVDLLIPFRCVKCGTILGEKEGLCTSCWAQIPFITKPYCACCGLPFDFEIEESTVCGACTHDLPSFVTARSVFAYTSESKDLILKFKHMDALGSAPLFAKWMARSLPELTDPLCIPVPLHWTRLFMRTYNQAALLAQEIAKLKGWTYQHSYLIRKRRTVSQGHLTKKERIKNVGTAFEVPQAKKRRIQGRTILLVDDVYTTGATLNACAKTLLKAGAQEVHTVTLGRVVRGQQVV